MVQVCIDYSPHPAQLLFHKSTARFRVLDCGRRFGKTLSSANEAIVVGTQKNNAVIWIICPVYSQSQVSWRMLRKVLLPTPLVKKWHISENYVELINGSTIWIKSSDNYDNLRSEGLDLAIMDEAAMMQPEVWIEVIRPSLGDKKGKAIFISTPKGLNWFYSLYLMGQDRKNNPDWESWKFSTLANPYFDIKEYEELKKSTPERIFRQEFEAEFLTDSGEVFRKIESCFVSSSLSIPKENESYIMGVDLARFNDFTVFTIIDSKGNIVYFDSFNSTAWEIQKARLISIAKNYKATVIIDRTGIGQPIFESLSTEENLNIIGYNISGSAEKSRLIESLILSIENQRLHWENSGDLLKLTHELKFYSMERSKSGRMTYNAPSGYNDDCVISLALANLAYQEGITSEWSIKDISGMLNFRRDENEMKL